MVSCVIYKIVSPNRRVYIGQTKDYKKRKANYRKLNCKTQKKLYNSFIKYGFENHKFEIIEECLEEDLNCRERHWQEHYDVLNGGLNCDLVSCDNNLKITSNSKQVYDTFYRVTYNSVNDVIRHTGETTIAQKLQGVLYNNTRFIYKEDFDNNVFREKTRPKYHRQVIDIVTFSVFDNIAIVSEIYNINKNTLKDYLDGKYENKTTLKYLDQNKVHEKYKPNTKKVIDSSNGTIYESITEAARVTGINRCSLKGYLNGNIQNKTTLIYYEG